MGAMLWRAPGDHAGKTSRSRLHEDVQDRRFGRAHGRAGASQSLLRSHFHHVAARGVQFSSRRVVRSPQHTSLEQGLHTNNRPHCYSERLFQEVLRGGAARRVELSSRRVARSTQHTSCSHSASLLRYCTYCWERMIYGTMIYYTNSSLIFGHGCGFSHKAREEGQ